MTKPYKIQVFGKRGCEKCRTLNQRLDKLLSNEKWKEFEKQYCDIETIDGLVAFASAECINPMKIPALLVTRHRKETDHYTPVSTRDPNAHCPVRGKSKLYQYIGLQTDYTEAGKGVISPKMIIATLKEAKG